MFDLPELKYNGVPALPPQMDDLKRLYDLIVNNFCLTVLEFGCGYSTFVIDKALDVNRGRWDALDNKPEVRNKNMFLHFSVDTDFSWCKEILSKQRTVILRHSSCRCGIYNGQMCHYYDSLPNIVPDFIYIDGPDPKQIKNDGGFWSECPERTPMSADLLSLEPTLIPGTIVLIDGRTNNARFLQRSLKRLWSFYRNNEEDYTIMRLEEERLGKINVIGRDVCEILQ